MKFRLPFKPRTLAVAAAVVASMAATAGIVALVETNLVTNTEKTLTYIYPTTATGSLTPTDANGFIIIDAKEGVGEPGIAVYDEAFSSGGTSFQGCIMASKIAPSGTDCSAGVDTGKRYKLRAAKINQPMDLQFTVDNTGAPMLYNVYGKLTNETGSLAKGFKVELGTGIGANFVPSTDTDGLTLQKVQPDYIGKYPGGLFGGSPAEGLPFFSTESAYYDASLSGDTLTADVVPTQYAALFGDWQTAADVPEAWFYDIDGRPWTDDKLLAWQDKTDGKWYTMQKAWNLPTTLLGIDLVANPLPLELSPALTPFIDVDALTDWLNNTGGFTGSAVLKVQEVVGEMVNYLTLTKTEVTAGFSGWFGTGDPAVWEDEPVTVRFSDTFVGADPTRTDAAAWPVVAIWYPDRGEDGLYVLEPAFVAAPVFAAIVEVDGTDSVVTAVNMARVVNNNTNDPGVSETDFYFGIPGYSQGAVEDLSNVNTFYAIEVGSSASTGTFTMRVTMTGDEPVAPPPVTPPVTPPTADADSGGGCTMAGGSVPMDPTLPLLAALGLAGWSLRRARRS